jgi:hypothetical protein
VVKGLVACKVLELVGNEVLHQEERRDESKSESQEGGREITREKRLGGSLNS